MKCYLCDKNEYEEYCKVGKTKILKCINCGFVQMEDREFSPNEIYGPEYFTHSKYKDREALKKEHKRRKNIIGKYITNGSNIIDIGCASGEFVNFIKESYNVYGNDFSEFAIKEAKRNNEEIKNHFFCGAIDESGLELESFDAICMWDVIEHLREPKEMINNLYKYIKKGGYMIISTPNVGSFFAKITGNKWPFMTPPEHLSFFDKNTLTNLFTSNGKWEVMEWSTKGKWANVGFILYKIKRVCPKLMPKFLISIFQNTIFRYLRIYVPTGDIQYIVVRKI